MDFLVDFIEKCSCFERADKLKLLLFALGIKPATFASLKVSPKNIGDKIHFEKHLADHDFAFVIDKPKSFEEIAKVSGNKIIWSLKGAWYGYDLFKDRKFKDLFKKYVYMIKKRKQDEADFIAGKLYGYPICCVRNYIRENNLDLLKKNYTYFQYYKKLHDMDRKFPFVVHTPCSTRCRHTQKMNTRNKNILRKNATRFYKDFTKKKSFKTDFIIEGENNLTIGLEGNPLWVKKDGHEYNLVSKKTFNRHHYMFSHLTKKEYKKGSLISGRAGIQHNYADIKLGRVKKVIKDLTHIRQFKLLGRKY